MRSSRIGVLLISAHLCRAVASVTAAEPTAEELRFFETKIRPVLVQHCYECHSAESDELRGNLAVDTREGLRNGGDNGPAVIPGDVDESFLLRVMRYQEDDYQMPPDGKLPDAVVRDFERWVEMGAPDPRDGPAPEPADDSVSVLGKGREFWAFQPLEGAQPPPVENRIWPQGPSDQYVLAQLEAAGLRPAAPASRESLLRRLYFDLIGLPPEPNDLVAFQSDDSPLATLQVIDRLLASPRFGEHWGRHWLDIARYADSNGLDQNLTYYNAWRYRDYVIASLNQDKPFDQFVVEQLAGDLLPFESDEQRSEQLIATGFLVVGPKQLSERDKEKLRMDAVDEQIDTLGKAFLGLTLGCARCHDHKFDPIPMKDYYGLAGIFRNTRTVDGIKLGNAFVSGWMVRPLPLSPEHAAALARHASDVDQLEKQLADAKAELKKLGSGVSDTPTVEDLLGVVVDDTQAEKVGQWKPSTYTPRYVGDGYVHDDRNGKGEKSITFRPELPRAGEYEVRLSYTGGGGRSKSVPVTIQHADGDKTIVLNQQEQPAIDQLFRVVGRYRFEAGRRGGVTISNRGTEGGHVIADAAQFVPVDQIQPDRLTAFRSKSGPDDSPRPTLREQKTAEVAGLEEQLKQLRADAPPPAPMAMAVEDVEQPDDFHLLIRGNHNRPGDPVSRSVITVALRREPPKFTQRQSGRLELARWIASPDNPLTARVYVNRIWQHLLGEGLVRSVDNVGHLGERPSHPKLLDHLASRFVAGGWSTKSLVREIVLSRTYQMSVTADSRSGELDPENRLLSHAHRRRVGAESIRDAMLAISRSLDWTTGGSYVSGLGEQAINNESKSPIDTDAIFQRSVYLPILRSDLPPILEVFDFADPEMVTGRRNATTVPTQALFLMNSPFVASRAQQTATRLLDTPDADSARVNWLYLACFGRSATADEVGAALSHLDLVRRDAGEAEGVERDRRAWTSLARAMFAATEFRFLE